MYVGSMIYIPCISPTTYGHSKVFRSFMYAKTFENEFVPLEVHDYLEAQLPDLEIFFSLSVEIYTRRVILALHKN